MRNRVLQRSGHQGATNVYVDAFNLYYGCLKGTPYRWLDLGALCAKLLPKDEINGIRYFTATVSARPDSPAPQHQQVYLRALETVPRLTIHYGHYLTHATRMLVAKPRPLGEQGPSRSSERKRRAPKARSGNRRTGSRIAARETQRPAEAGLAPSQRSGWGDRPDGTASWRRRPRLEPTGSARAQRGRS
jgi:hypothetical protein